MTRPKATDLAYAAGIIDGEGRIQQHTHRRSMYVGFRNCDLDLLNWFVITFGGGIYHNKDDRPNRQPCYHWRLGVADSAQFLEWIEPYLIIKREDALRALSKYAER